MSVVHIVINLPTRKLQIWDVIHENITKPFLLAQVEFLQIKEVENLATLFF